MHDLSADVHRHIAVILDEHSPRADVAAAVERLHHACVALSGLRETDSDETRLESGRALSPVSAASCMQDVARTVAFMRAVNAAANRLDAQPIEVLYAGCGPLAPMILPLLAREDVRITLLDVHARSLDAARQLIDALGRGAIIRDLVRVDAMAYTHPCPANLIIVEMMQRALAHEPQVEVTRHLGKQLARNGVFIPERVIVDAYLCDVPHELGIEAAIDPRRVFLGNVLTLVPSIGELHSVELVVPSEIPPQRSLMLGTEIQVFDRWWVREKESGLTQPAIEHTIGYVRPGATFSIDYRVGADPGFVVASRADEEHPRG